MTDPRVRSCVPSLRLLLRALPAAALVALATLLDPIPLAAQSGVLTGRVTDAETGEPVTQVLVEAMSGATRVRSATTDESGEFQLTGLQPGTYSLVFSRIAYETRRIDGIVVGDAPSNIGTVTLVSRAFRLNPIVVSASKQEEKALEAPAAVSVVERREIEEQPATTAVDHVKGVKGADIVTTGLAQHNVVARGGNNVFSGALFVLTDNRWASVPSLRFNAYNMIPATSEDIERIEFVLGPGSALYGPNVDKGVMHIITRSPLEAQETTLSLVSGLREGRELDGSDGARGVNQATLRHAGLLSENVGYKISGMYFRGRDWFFEDSVEVGTRAVAQACLANFNLSNPACQAFAPAPTVLPDADQLARIGARDYDAERFLGELRVDARLDEATSLIFSGGASQMVNSIEMTGIGAAMAKDWRYVYLQGRLRHKRLFAQTYINFSDAGETFTLRDGGLIEDNSLLYVGQIQHGTTLGDAWNLIYGADLIRTTPKTNGTIHGRNEDDDNITEVGGYLQAEWAAAPKLDFVAAARVDYHSVIDETVFSPRLGAVLKPADGQNFRVTWNRAFSQPSSVNLFLDLLSSPTLGALPFAVRASGAVDAFTFLRDPLGRPLIRSPFTSDLNPALSDTLHLPIDATFQLLNPAFGDSLLFWPIAVAIFEQATGTNLSDLGIPAPSPDQVPMVMRELDATTLAFNTVTEVTDVAAIEPTTTNTWEVGYKGILGDRFLVGVDVYYTRAENFIGPLLVETPNVFLDRAALATYLTPFVGPVQAQQIAAGMGGVDGNPSVTGIPLATVSPELLPGETRAPADLMLTYRNFGDIDLWGVDLGATLLATSQLSFTGTYSWASENLFLDQIGTLDLALNAPRNKGSLSGTYRSDRLGLAVELRGRYVEDFPVESGVYRGRVEGYTLFDANVAYALPFARSTELTLSANNVFDERHREMVGAPDLGRLLLFRLRQTF